jgi:3-dehydroquinate synthase
VGNFNQPEFVICDVSMLKSLAGDEYLSGLAELIKMGIILDNTLLGEIENNREAILKRDIPVLEALITRSVKLKAEIVTEDERESGKRMILNFGHTFGHVIETVGHQKHGFAVAAGMVIAAGISNIEGLLSVNDLTRIVSLLKQFDLLKKFDIAQSLIAGMITKDKKKSGDEISFVLVGKPGEAIVKKISVDRLMDDYEKVYHLL